MRICKPFLDLRILVYLTHPHLPLLPIKHELARLDTIVISHITFHFLTRGVIENRMQFNAEVKLVLKLYADILGIVKPMSSSTEYQQLHVTLVTHSHIYDKPFGSES